MNKHQEQKHLQEQFPEVLDELGKLRRVIDSQTYPGQAWPVRRLGLRRLVRPAIAAAAVVALTAGLGLWLYSSGDLSEPRGIPEAIVQASSQDEPGWAVPSNIGLSLAGSVKWKVPASLIPSAADFGGLELAVPSISFPSLTEERSNSNGV